MSGTTLLRVVTTDPTPPYEQLRRQLAELISSGVLAPGDRLPPLRQLAADLGLAVGTVARTYRELEAAGLVRSRRGGGTRVQAPGPRQGAGNPAEEVRGHAEAFVRQARLLGASDADVRAAVAAALAGTGAGALPG
ncbi:MAG TPA: GntR family transcriptional regulator [Blastococcus sp.]|jgi:DNA-binding transcriptional regulator YhcF (GntR family)|nr:GntR family transcriptional regulator [Blastococcus sp.]